MDIDRDAIIWSAPERERAARPLIVLLHGFGSHEGDLFQLSPRLPLGPVIASLRAPIASNGGWAWFSPEPGRQGDPDPDAVTEVAREIVGWLESVEHTSLAVLGFSQGAAVALQLLRLLPTGIAATVALSGFVAGGELAGDDDLRILRPPVFWGRGTLDSVIPESAVERTDSWLATHASASVRIYEDLGHSISAAELTEISAFLSPLLR